MPYECNGCGKKFRYKVSQRSHKCIVPTKNNESAIHHQSQTEVNSHSSVEQNKTIFHMKDTPICKKKDPQKNFNSNTNDYQCFLNYTTKNTQKTGEFKPLDTLLVIMLSRSIWSRGVNKMVLTQFWPQITKTVTKTLQFLYFSEKIQSFS